MWDEMLEVSIFRFVGESSSQTAQYESTVEFSCILNQFVIRAGESVREDRLLHWCRESGLVVVAPDQNPDMLHDVMRALPVLDNPKHFTREAREIVIRELEQLRELLVVAQRTGGYLAFKMGVVF